MRFTFGMAALAALELALPGTAGAVTSFSAHMVGERAVPPNNSQGDGDALFVLDDLNEFTYFIQLLGTLSGPATGCNVCGPARAGETAPALFPPIPQPGSYMEGSFGTLTDEQITQLKDGLWYCNLETRLYPSGELRCQILDVVAVVPGTWGAIKQFYR